MAQALLKISDMTILKWNFIFLASTLFAFPAWGQEPITASADSTNLANGYVATQANLVESTVKKQLAPALSSWFKANHPEFGAPSIGDIQQLGTLSHLYDPGDGSSLNLGLTARVFSASISISFDSSPLQIPYARVWGMRVEDSKYDRDQIADFLSYLPPISEHQFQRVELSHNVYQAHFFIDLPVDLEDALSKEAVENIYSENKDERVRQTLDKHLSTSIQRMIDFRFPYLGQANVSIRSYSSDFKKIIPAGNNRVSSSDIFTVTGNGGALFKGFIFGFTASLSFENSKYEVPFIQGWGTLPIRREPGVTNYHINKVASGLLPLKPADVDRYEIGDHDAIEGSDMFWIDVPGIRLPQPHQVSIRSPRILMDFTYDPAMKRESAIEQYDLTDEQRDMIFDQLLRNCRVSVKETHGKVDSGVEYVLLQRGHPIKKQDPLSFDLIHFKSERSEERNRVGLHFHLDFEILPVSYMSQFIDVTQARTITPMNCSEFLSTQLESTF